MELQDLLDQIKELCTGMTAEEIETELSNLNGKERIPNIPMFAKYLASIAAEPDEESVAGPEDDVDMDES